MLCPYKETRPYSPTIRSIVLGGMTSPFLSAAMVSTERVVEVVELVKRQIEAVMFSAEVLSVEKFTHKKLQEGLQ